VLARVAVAVPSSAVTTPTRVCPDADVTVPRAAHATSINAAENVRDRLLSIICTMSRTAPIEFTVSAVHSDVAKTTDARRRIGLGSSEESADTGEREKLGPHRA